ncbi:MAG: hypothetical protein KJ052_03315 [Candidatus Hydrogenedentes bacterium]|nr:hypothetical protein [Candidatus Hydrogenedentota bacterium]
MKNKIGGQAWHQMLLVAVLIVILGGINFATVAGAQNSSYAIAIRLTDSADEPIILDHIPVSIATANLVEIKRGELRSDWVYDVPLADVQDLKTLLASMKVALVTLRPAETVKVQLVIEVMEALKEAGIERVEVAAVEQTPQRMRQESEPSRRGLFGQGLAEHSPTAGGLGSIPQKETKTFAEESLINKMKILGIVFKMYSNESKGEKYPPRTAQPGGFYPQDDLLYPEYVTGPETIDFLKSLTGVRVCYTGYLMHDDTSGQQYLKAYREGSQPLMANEDVELPDGTWLMRLREGIQRFMITDINDPNQGNYHAARAPISWTMPDDGKGGYVLYLDGHVEWVDMGSKFPMTEEFIAGLNEVMAPKKP